MAFVARRDSEGAGPARAEGSHCDKWEAEFNCINACFVYSNKSNNKPKAETETRKGHHYYETATGRRKERLGPILAHRATGTSCEHQALQGKEEAFVRPRCPRPAALSPEAMAGTVVSGGSVRVLLEVEA